MKCQTPNCNNERLELTFVRKATHKKTGIKAYIIDRSRFKYCDDCASEILLTKLQVEADR